MASALMLFASLGLAQDATPVDGEATVDAAQNDTPVDDEATARSLYDAGLGAFEEGRYDIALESFSAGYELSGRAQFLFNMASSFDRLHRTSEAVAHYERFLEAQPEAANRDHVEGRLTLLHQELREANREPEPEPTNSFLRAPALVGFGFGVAGLSTFAVAGLISNGQYADLENGCAPACNDDELRAVRRNTLISDIGLGVGIAGIAFAIIYGLVTRNRAEEPSAVLRVEPRADGAAVEFGGRF